MSSVLKESYSFKNVFKKPSVRFHIDLLMSPSAFGVVIGENFNAANRNAQHVGFVLT